jgi:hypothetical protein
MNGKFPNKRMSVLLCESLGAQFPNKQTLFYVIPAVHILAINILTNKGT